MMKKITIIFNGICLALALITVLKGAATSLVVVLIYGMSFGAVLTHQKKTYYYITLVLNGTLLIAGLSLIFYESSRVIKSLNQGYIILMALFLMLIFTPLLNLIFIKTKMIVLNRVSLRNSKNDSYNNNLLLEEDELPDGWVLLNKSTSESFTKQLTRELSKNHVLYNKTFLAIARYDGRDDVLFQIKISKQPLYVVHLTFGGQGKDSTWPRAIAFDSKSDFINNCLID